MRRIAKGSCLVTPVSFFLLSIFVSFVPAQAQPKKAGVIVRGSDASQVDRLSQKFNWRVQLKVSVGNGALFVINDVSEGQAKQLLKNEPTVVFVEEDKVIPLEDGGETVVPLDGGETVVPLDGGETVVPLGTAGDQLISQLTGQSSLPFNQLTTIRNAYARIAALVTPSPRLILQPSFSQIGLYSSIAQTTGRGVVIADLDTGADTCHPVLQGITTYTFVAGTDANAPENCPNSATTVVPGYGHGTAVASLLRLVAPSANVWAIRVFDNTGSAQTSSIYAAMVFAANSGVNIINMSFGTSTYSETLADAVSYAQSMGVTLVAAGGNSNVAPLMYPAQLPGVAGVVAVTNADIKTPFSNYGFGADVSAPGYGLWVAYPGNQMTYVAGTSYASPLVAAEAADVIDSYQQIFRGQPGSSLVNRQISRAVLPIDWLNPGYAGQLGSGRIYIPFSVFGIWPGAF